MGTFMLRQGAGATYMYVPRAELLFQTARFRMCPATWNAPPFSLPLLRLWAACLLLVLDAVLLVVGMLCTPLRLPLLRLIPAAVPWLLLPQALPGPLLVLFLPVRPPRLLSLLLLLLLLKIISPLQPLRKLLGSSTQQNRSKKACGIISLLYVFLSFASAAAAAAITIAPPLLSAVSRHTVAAGGQRLLHRAAAAGTEPLSWPAAAAVPSPSAAVLSLTGAGGVSPLCRTAAAATTSLLWPPLAAASSSRHLPAAAFPFCSAAAALPSPCRRAAIPPAAAAVPAAPPVPSATTDTRTTLPRTASTGRAHAAAGTVDSRVAGKTSQATRTAPAPLAAATAVQAAAAAPAATQHRRPAAAEVLPLPPLVAAPVRLAEAAAAAAKCLDTAPAPLLRGTSLRVASAAAPFPVSAKPPPTTARAAAGPGRRKHLHVLCTCIGRREKELVLLLLLGPTPFFVNPLYVPQCSQAAAAAAAARQSSPCSAVSTRRKYLSTEPPQQQGRQRSRQQRPLFHQQFLPQGRNDGFLTRDAGGIQDNAAIAAAAPWTAVAALNRRGTSCSYAPTTCALSSRPAAAAANVTAEAAGGAAAAAKASAAAAAGSTRARALSEERRAATAEGTALLEEKGAGALAPAPGEATAAPGSAVAQNLSPVAAGRAARDAAHTSCGPRDTSERRKCVVFDLSDRLLPYDLAWRLQQTLLQLQLLRLQRRCSAAASSACLNYASAGATVGSSAAAAGTATAGAAVVPAVTALDVPHPSAQQKQQKQPALQRSQQEQQSVLLHGPQPQPPQQHQEFSTGQQVHRATQPERQLLHTEAETPEDYLLLLQHPSVYTVGQGGKTCNILFNSSIRQLRLTSAEQQELTTEEGCMQVLQQLLRRAAASPYAFSFQRGRAAAEAAGQDDDSKVRRCRRTDGGKSSTTGINTDSNSGTTSNTSDVSSSSTSNTSSSNGSCVGPVSRWTSSSSSDFDVYRVERGGEATYHGPGQLVLYPVLDLRHHACDVKWYITSLEQVVINAVRRMATWSRVTGRKTVVGAGTTIRGRSSKVSCRSSSRQGGPATAATAERDAFAETLARRAAETGKSEELPAQRAAAAARMSTAATSRFAAHAVRAVAQETAAATAETRATAEMRAAVATEAPAAAATEAPPAGGALTGAAKQEVGGVLQDEIEVLIENFGKTAVGVLTRKRQHATPLAAAVAEADCSRWERRGESETKAPAAEGAAESGQQAAPAHEEHAVQEAAAAGGQHPSRPLLRACSYREQADLASAAAATNQEVTDALLLNGVHRVEGLPGVWVDKKSKICSIGVKLKRWITQHGLALNITTDTRAFRRIVPCGLHGCVMQSLKQLIHSRTSSHNRLWQRPEEGEEEEEEEEEKSLQLAEQHEKEDLLQQGLRRKEADGELRQQGRQTAEAELQPSGVEQGQQPCQAGDEQQKGQQQEEGDRHRQPQQRKQQQQLGHLRWHEQNQQRMEQEHEQHQDQQQQQQQLELQHVWQPHEQVKSMLRNEERKEEVKNRTAVLSLLPKGHDDANESSTCTTTCSSSIRSSGSTKKSSSCTSSANSSSSRSTTETSSPFSSRSSTDSNTDGTSSSRVREEQQRIAGASAAMKACSELPVAVSAPRKGPQQQPWKQKERDVNGREEATAICGSKQHRDSGSHSRFGYIEHSMVQEKQVHTADGREEEQREEEEEARRDGQLFRHVTALIKEEFSHVFDVHLIERY